MRARLLLPLVLLACLSLASCSGQLGDVGCGGADFGHSNSEYAGHYSGEYVSSGVGKDLTFDVTVDSMGTVSGNVTEKGTGNTSEVTGNLIDWEHPCSNSETLVSFRFTFTGENARDLYGNRAKGQTNPWPFTGNYSREDATTTNLGSGKLTLNKL